MSDTNDTQQDLIDYVNDDENIKKAVEGSMEKRRRVLYPDDTLREQILRRLLDGWTDKTSATVTDELMHLISQDRVERDIDSRLDEARQNYSLLIKTIQEKRDNPKLMWHELTMPLVDRLAELKKQRKAVDG